MGKAVKAIAGVVLIVVGSVVPGAQQLIYVGLAMLAGAAADALMKKPKMGRGQGLQTNFADTIASRRLNYGTLRVGGMHAIPPLSSGTAGENGHAMVVMAGHEVADITDVYLDNDLISSASIGAVTGASTDGQVVTGKYAPGGDPHIWIRRYLGTATQNADFILRTAFPTPFTTNFRLRGNAYVALQAKYNSKIFTSWPNITAIVKGQKVYDPRLDSTKSGGAGTHREDDATTWAHSANPILIQRHFLVHEVGFSHAEMSENESLIMSSANVCDAAVAIPGGTQARWTCNVQLLATDPWESNLQVLVDACEGHSVYIDGKWYLYAGAWQTPDVTVNQGDWVAPMQVGCSANRDERWNFVRGWYVDPNRNWQRVECYPRRNSAYETADGGERIPVEIEMAYCASSVGTKHAEYEAQRHAEHQLRKSRNQIKVSGTLKPEFSKLIPGNTINLNDSVYGWVNKTFRIVAIETGVGPSDGAVGVALIEEASAVWTDMVAGDYNTESASSVLDPGVTLPLLNSDPVVIVGPNTISFNVTAGVPSTQPAGTVYVVVENASSNFPPTSASEVGRGASPIQVILRADANTRWYWMFAEVGTYRSGFRPTSAGIAVAPMSYGPASLTFTQQPTNVSTTRAGGTNANSVKWSPGVTITPTTPYATWIGNNGTVTASWQVMSYWYAGANTPSPILPATVTNNGSYVPTFYLPNTVLGYTQQHTTQMRLTIRDSVNTVQSNNFTVRWISGADLN